MSESAFRFTWVHWLLVVLVVPIIILGGRNMWIAACVAFGTWCALNVPRTTGKWSRVGLIVGAVVLIGGPVTWIVGMLLL